MTSVRYNFLMMMGDVKLSPRIQTLIGIGGTEVTTIGCLATNVDFYGITVPITFHAAQREIFCIRPLLETNSSEYELQNEIGDKLTSHKDGLLNHKTTKRFLFLLQRYKILRFNESLAKPKLR